MVMPGTSPQGWPTVQPGIWLRGLFGRVVVVVVLLVDVVVVGRSVVDDVAGVVVVAPLVPGLAPISVVGASRQIM